MDNEANKMGSLRRFTNWGKKKSQNFENQTKFNLKKIKT